MIYDLHKKVTHTQLHKQRETLVMTIRKFAKQIAEKLITRTYTHARTYMVTQTYMNIALIYSVLMPLVIIVAPYLDRYRP